MQPCLAATGSDPTLFIVLAGVLLLLGAVVAVVAIRRGKAGAALLVLALPFLIGAPLLSSAAPASAQVGVPCPTSTPAPMPTPTPTETCEPAEAVEGETFEGSDWAFVDNGYRSQFTAGNFSDADAIEEAVLAIDDTPTRSVTLRAQSGDTVYGPIELQDPDFEIDTDASTLWIAQAVFDEAVDFEVGGAWVDFRFDYEDGCGNALVTEITLAADVVPIVIG